ncbi:MAG: hypothetical protein A2750_01405 [Candidatus Yanofskybacteria bacterium RIFCSPHIGHO2_01_FULL_45_42]|uniref:Uncharacterized protein n=2 Tax=Parcubacteria group TaxID=1794811 RepID=A0A1G1ZR93_9BACT|nr:MAG: hypothetical protein A2750_01405 [Candidatus Yanofskybacteria bacterium RIFCSPHIGHO2_01_FULL_45_42]OGY63884.1 MAG: hypothetical protein A3J53_03625 [Candidatus Harrisonbacteria bacterium RIFCSPHIGHO2_02_FULL_40_20]OGY66969.1 MAG: hypothetical protein A3I24_00635 [Candidatus Harrisonbacteria bacterium RIFCSPLOWO2_02_FULL_41_13b]
MPIPRDEVSSFTEARIKEKAIARTIITDFLRKNIENFYSFDELARLVVMNKSWIGVGELTRAVASVLASLEIDRVILSEHIDSKYYYAWRSQ